jgi:hypothetical protein
MTVSTPKSKILVEIIENRDPKEDLPKGLFYVVTIQEKDIDSAMGMAESIVSYLSSLISLVSGVAVNPPTRLLAYTLDDNISKHILMQFEMLENFNYSVGNANTEDLKNIAQKITNEPEEIRNRIISSTQFFRSAQTSEEPFTRFIFLWLSLELLNYVLLKKLNIRGKRTTTKGIKKFLRKNHPSLIKDFRKVQKLRGKSFHATTDFAIVRNKSLEMTPFLVNLYVILLSSILDFNTDLVKQKFVARFGVKVQLIAEIELATPGKLVKDESIFPHFDFDFDNFGKPIKLPNGRYAFESKIKIPDPINISDNAKIKKKLNWMGYGCDLMFKENECAPIQSKDEPLSS